MEDCILVPKALPGPIGRRRTVCLAALVALTSIVRADDPVPLEVAQHFLLTGKYAEADEKFNSLVDNEPVASAIGKARCQRAIGDRDAAAKTIEAAIEKHPDDARLHAELALLKFDRGDYAAAERSSSAAIKMDENQPAARWIQAELLRVGGKLDDAERAYQWAIEYYNKAQPTDAESLYYIGLSTAQFARWNRLSDQFSFLVNELYPDALANNPDFWPARLAAGLLYVEKYNQAEAAQELKAAQILNPNSAEVHAALAALAVQNFEISQAREAVAQAIEINPKLLAPQLVLADIHLANFEPQLAVDTLRGAVELHPTHEATLGRMAAALAALDGLQQGDVGPRAQKIIDEVTKRNPHAGEFFYAMAETFDKLRRFPSAASFYQLAGKAMPQLIYPSGQEGMMLMRLGDEERARKLLEAAFDADPFNVRVSNTIKVLEVLDDYETLETEHFLIRFDPKFDKILAHYAAQWLEAQYPPLCKQFQFQPPGKSLFEIFNKSRTTDGHGWFSARMVGLPHIHTIGACAGQMVAMQSPNEGRKFNWARVLKHEFIHVLNLQQTNFNIPHWYTEALATLNEGYPRPKPWNDLLSSRLAEHKLFTLDNINLGFIRARDSDDWNMAYCQAELYAEFMLAKFGDDALARMLSAYADNLNTRAAIERSFSINQAEFDRRYLDYVRSIVAGLPKTSATDDWTPAAIEQALKADPMNSDLLAQSARTALDRKDYAQARRQADAALKIEAKNQLAAYVRARLYLLLGETRPAVELLAGALDEAKPQVNLLGLLAGLRLKADDCTEAARLYELGARSDPSDTRWTKALARVYVQSNQDEMLTPLLAKLAELDADDVAIRKKLADLAMKAKDFAAVERWSREALQIDVMDAGIHRTLAEALEINGKPEEAKQERALADEIEGGP